MLALRLLRTPLAFGVGFGMALVAPFVGISLIKSLSVKLDEQAFVHHDRSVFDSGARPSVDAPVRFRLERPAGTRHVDLTMADAASFAADVQSRLAQRRRALDDEIDQIVARAIGPIELDVEARIEAYVDWYFGWLTSYRLAGVAALSAVDHAFEVRVTSLAEAVDFDLGRHLRRHYEELVLEPEITEPLLRRAFEQSLASTRIAYTRTIEELVEAADRELTSHSPVRRSDEPPILPEVTVDWASQVHKLKVAHHERGVVDGGIRAGLLGALGATGARAAIAVAGVRSGASALPALTSRAVARPFAGRGLGRVALSAAGATVAGPVGFALGLGAGAAVDLAINRTDELLHRDALEAGIRRSVRATFDELRQDMRAGLSEATDVWFDDARAALAVQLR